VNLKQLIRTKTFWAGLTTAIVGCIVLTGDTEKIEGVKMIMSGLTVIFVRDAIQKVTQKSSE
jgi:hypothetical protein